MEPENPWNVKSIYELQFFNCPDCVYINHSKQEFVIHAYESHPNVIHYFNKIEDDSLNDVNCPWNINENETKDQLIEIKSEDEYKDYDQMEISSETKTDFFIDVEDAKEYQCCDVCFETFSSTRFLKNHITSVHHKCETCGKAFNESGDLSKHVKIVHEGVKNHKCETCNKTFSVPSKLKIHVSSVHEGLRYKCEICVKDFSMERTLMKHKKKVHNIIVELKCEREDCDEKFGNPSSLNKHINISHKETECDNCGKKFSSNKNLKSHMIYVHEKQRKCKFCNEKFMSHKTLQNHIKENHEQEMVHEGQNCEKCGKMFKSKSLARQHFRRQHINILKHMCHLCGKDFHSEKYVNEHISFVHEGVKIFKCDYCSKVFAHNDYLITHVNIFHGSSQNIPCESENCEKVFKNDFLLKKHVSHVHKKTICSICGKKISPNFIKQHMASAHTGKGNDKNLILKCKICEKPFATAGLLNKHMNIHTGVKPYKCQYCEQKFADGSNKIAHEKSVHEGIKRLQKKKKDLSNETNT